ncbi:MAG: aspartate aminotransferase family protein [Micrococcales bacterium 70-64]|nr:aspartate aminotransferase family protein [Leifsonia sp.]ODU65987.1 MAG: pyridoxal-dependent decarboxylase [Leifsonia sp. SCN 70-46]OJX84613.1 MAG: aspartate aminotransferase family protein [Micrococcales bacterium 70-64]
MQFAEQPADILARLEQLRAADAPTHGGHVLSYVYDSGLAELDELAAASIRAVQPVNGLDPTTFTSVAVMEGEVVAFARDLLGGDSDVVGSVTTGGTESCLLAVKTARDLWTGSGRPRLVAPVTVHAAFHKAAHYFGLELDLVPVGQDGRPSAQAVIERLGEDVALVVVSAPSYPHAALDPVAEVAAAAAAAGIPCHVDACIGGWVLPFWSGLAPWDFRVPGVTSVSADLHKFGYAPKGVSVLLQRGRDRQRAQFFTTTRWPGYPVVNPTMLGSKSAGALAAGWAITHALGRDGLAELAASCERSTAALVALVDGIEGLRVVGSPVGPLIAVAADEGTPADRRVDPHHWADQARAHGWLLQLQPGLAQSDGSVLPHTTHLTITPVTEAVLPELSAALVTAADEVRGVPAVSPADVLGALPGLPDGPLDSAAAAAILGSIGLVAGDSGGLPDRMAPFLALVGALPAPLVERLLTELIGRVVEPR